jgi:DnaJ-class molecular chaperone
LCPHGKADRGYYCKECPGKGICEHGRVRTQCKECGGSGICEHGRRRSRCKECVRSSRIRVGAVEVPIEAKVEIKEEPEDVADPGVEIKEEPEDVEDPGVEVEEES